MKGTEKGRGKGGRVGERKKAGWAAYGWVVCTTSGQDSSPGAGVGGAQ